MKNEEERGDNIWSEWLDFNLPSITTAVIANKPGVFKLHADMKILFIGSSSTNLQQSLVQCMSDPCISKAKRFSYMITENSEQIKDHLLMEYRKNHGGNLPLCMEEQKTN